MGHRISAHHCFLHPHLGCPHCSGCQKNFHLTCLPQLFQLTAQIPSPAILYIQQQSLHCLLGRGATGQLVGGIFCMFPWRFPKHLWAEVLCTLGHGVAFAMGTEEVHRGRKQRRDGPFHPPCLHYASEWNDSRSRGCGGVVQGVQLCLSSLPCPRCNQTLFRRDPGVFLDLYSGNKSEV